MSQRNKAARDIYLNTYTDMASFVYSNSETKVESLRTHTCVVCYVIVFDEMFAYKIPSDIKYRDVLNFSYIAYTFLVKVRSIQSLKPCACTLG